MRLIFVLFATVLPRILLAVNFFGTPDTVNSLSTVEAYLAGKNIYATYAFTYPPLWLYLMLGLKFLSNLSGISFIVLLRLPAIFGDVLTTIFIYLVGNKIWPKNNSFSVALAFALNPVSILVSGYHGQIDNLWIISSLFSWYFFTFFNKNHVRIILSSIFLSFGIALKVFPVLFLPLFLLRIKNFKSQITFIFISLLPLLLSLIKPMERDFGSVVNNLINYQIEHNFWGISGLIAFLKYHNSTPYLDYVYQLLTWPQLERLPLYLFLIFIFCLLKVYQRHILLVHGMFIVILSVLLLTPFFSIQWLVWPIALALFFPKDIKYLIIYTTCASLLLVSRYYLYLANIPPEFRPVPILSNLGSFKIDSLNKLLAFFIWIFLWFWLLKFLRFSKFKTF